MSALAPTLEAYFTDRLSNQQQASSHTVTAYRDTFRLLLTFAHHRTDKNPSALNFEHLDVPMIAEFLDHLENERGNGVRTRNTRLAAVHSFYRYAALQHPEHAALIARVLAIPAKRFDQSDVSFLDQQEIDALLAAVDRTRWIGRRDHSLLTVAIQTGLRVSELTGLRCQDLHLGNGAHVRCLGKGRKARCTPLTAHTVKVAQAWIDEHNGRSTDALFPTRRGTPLSRDAVALLVNKYAKIARQTCPSLHNKTVSPHVLRHTAAMALVRGGVESTVIALWLGHETTRTTDIYIHADLALKERAMARTTPPTTAPGRYRPPDNLLAFLDSL